MRHSRRIKNFIKSLERYSASPYRDQAGYWTIGYGHRLKNSPETAYASEATASHWLDEELDRIDKFLNRCIRVNLTQRQWDALVSLTFNIGAMGFRYSTALERLNSMDLHGAAEAMLWWNKITIDGEKQVSGGLVKRRCREVLIFLGDEDQIIGYQEEL